MKKAFKKQATYLSCTYSEKKKKGIVREPASCSLMTGDAHCPLARWFAPFCTMKLVLCRQTKTPAFSPVLQSETTALFQALLLQLQDTSTRQVKQFFPKWYFQMLLNALQWWLLMPVWQGCYYILLQQICLLHSVMSFNISLNWHSSAWEHQHPCCRDLYILSLEERWYFKKESNRHCQWDSLLVVFTVKLILMPHHLHLLWLTRNHTPSRWSHRVPGNICQLQKNTSLRIVNIHWKKKKKWHNTLKK